jgi:hypothetical protein
MERPVDFPYWENVTQRRYEGPTVIYLGAGYALTARHVGVGEIPLAGRIFAPVRSSARTLLNEDGSAADAMIFELDRSAALPDLPIVPLARSRPKVGEDVIVIGFGAGREKVLEWTFDDQRRFAFVWSQDTRKRWGTNRIESSAEVLLQGRFATRAIAFDFDEPFAATATRYEAQAAIGDSGGAVFVERDGEWQLAGMMVSVTGDTRAPKRSSTYGDMTFAADLSFYRSEILRWTRPACANEQDDDGDELTDYPADPGCDDALDRDERDGDSGASGELLTAAFATLGVGIVLAFVLRGRKPR